MKLLIRFFTFIALSAAVLSPLPAAAYIGPGAAVALLGYVFGPVIAIIACVALVLLWPARWLYKRMKAKKSEEAAQNTNANQQDEAS